MMAFDLISRQMVAFHGEGILQTKHFHDDDIEDGSVQCPPWYSPSDRAEPTFWEAAKPGNS